MHVMLICHAHAWLFYYISILSRIGLSYQLYMLCALMLQQGSQKIRSSLRLHRYTLCASLFKEATWLAYMVRLMPFPWESWDVSSPYTTPSVRC
jgi:hypothetical protein